MRDDGWEVKRHFPKAIPKFPATPAKNYSRPEICRVSVILEADEPSFAPSSTSDDGSATVFANLPSGGLALPHGGSAVVDCGFSVTLPAGYRTRVTSAVAGLSVDVVDSKRFKLSVTNLGEETTLKDRGAIAMLWVEPVYFFDWITRL